MDIRFTGELKGLQLLSPLIKSECAFRVVFKNGKEILVGFRKGNWSFGRLKDGRMSEILSLDDGGSVDCDDKESLAFALLTTIRGQVAEKDEAKDPREYPANILINFFGVWGGPDVTEVEVIQWGRNSFLDAGGVFHLAPEKP